ncbi:MAG: hypothetical protein J7K31_02605 [Candidatus Aenigmarchaeota archaeon]|nr:hypothetical protein [Candidatus Aenigmarchaeota archaeon]
MKNLFAVLVVLLLVMPVFAQGPVGNAAAKPVIQKLAILGKGIATNPSDLMDFKIIKIGIGEVKVSLLGEETELVVGVLYLDSDKYKVKDVVLGNGSIEANLYSGEEKVGSINAESVEKEDTEVWVGTIDVGGATYNAYVLGAVRKARPLEIAQKVRSFCEENPTKCKAVVKAIGNRYCEKNPTDPSCREKVKSFCLNHPDDHRCKEIFKEYCVDNLDDARCRYALRVYCKNHPNEDRCKIFLVQTTEKYCLQHPKAPACVKVAKVRKLVKEKIRARRVRRLGRVRSSQVVNPPTTNETVETGPEANTEINTTNVTGE